MIDKSIKHSLHPVSPVVSIRCCRWWRSCWCPKNVHRVKDVRATIFWPRVTRWRDDDRPRSWNHRDYPARVTRNADQTTGATATVPCTRFSLFSFFFPSLILAIRPSTIPISDLCPLIYIINPTATDHLHFSPRAMLQSRIILDVGR